ncbi:MAG: hypothetical protein HF978_11135 [Desulfobacteraceae bacterium]|nr:hypothetical protein [Desulfobacteraceae bacterium]MBC2756090.1 hypothetical protein [Desulfobacteraceae bacterium]MBC2763753.1 hypothetical protein [ANME-2 cluster archaeon]
MKIFFAFLLIIFLVFSGYHLSFRKFGIPLFARTFYLTGLEFLFLGLLLGPQFLNILDVETCGALAPVSALLLGWIGMLFGFQFEISKLRRFPRVYFLAGFLESFLTLIVVFGGIYFTLPFILKISEPMRAVISVVLASAAACTAQTGLAMFSSSKIGKNQSMIKILRYLSSIDGLVAMLAMLPVFVFFPRSTDIAASRFLFGYDIFIAMIIFTAILILYNLFLVYRREQSELVLIIIGMVIFISGFSTVMNFSPLLSNFFVGVCLVNLTSEKEKIFTTLVSIEKPVYLLLLVFLGSAWHLQSFWALAAAGGYFVIRFTGKMIGGFSISLLGLKMKEYPAGLGLGLIGQGGLPLAILYDFQQGFQLEVADVVVGIALIAIIYSDVMSPNLIGRFLKKGE